jgi:hypothetical protein
MMDEKTIMTMQAEEDPRTTARRDVLSTELATLQAELEHEQSLRQLEAKRFEKEFKRQQKKLDLALEEATEAQTLLEEIQQESEHHIQQQREARRKAQLELIQVQEQLEETQALAAREACEQDPRIQLLQEHLDAKTEETERLQTTCHDLRKQAQVNNDNNNNNNNSNKDNQSPTPSIRTLSESPPAVMKELNRVRIQLAETERKNRQLKRVLEDLQKKATLLIQEKETSKSATNRLTQVEEQLFQLQTIKSQDAAILESWLSFGKFLYALLEDTTAPTNMPPEQGRIQRFLQEHSKRAESFLKETKTLEKSLNRAEDSLQSLQRRTNELTREKESMEKRIADQTQALALKEKALQLKTAQELVWKREMNSLREIVTTFDNLPLANTNTTTTNTLKPSSMEQVRLDSAQQEIDLLKQAQESLQDDLNMSLKEKEELQASHSNVVAKFGKLKDALYEERTKANKAEERANRAEALAGKGSFNPETTRVLHLSQNPVTEALREEVTVLQRQVQAIKKNNPSSSMIDVDPNKLHQRLKESFKEQIGKFREGVYLITGLKIDMIPSTLNTKFKVRSVFAEQEHDHLLLQWPPNTDSMDLLATDLAQALTATPSYEYIRRCHSMPAFVASVQLSLFEKQTMM